MNTATENLPMTATPPPIPSTAKLATPKPGDIARRNIVVGALWCGGGILVTAATYSAAKDGGTFIVAWGAILFGGLRFLKGLCQLAD